jgi:hypothetical protein
LLLLLTPPDNIPRRRAAGEISKFAVNIGHATPRMKGESADP